MEDNRIIYERLEKLDQEITNIAGITYVRIFIIKHIFARRTFRIQLLYSLSKGGNKYCKKLSLMKAVIDKLKEADLGDAQVAIFDKDRLNLLCRCGMSWPLLPGGILTEGDRNR